MTTHQDPTDPAPFSDEELDELERLDKAGTPEPWTDAGNKIGAAGGGIAEVYFDEDADRVLAVRARNALPRLLSGYRALREENERLRTERDDLRVRLAEALFREGKACLARDKAEEEAELRMGELENSYAESEELRNRLLEEHEGNPGRVEAGIWEKRAHDLETESFLERERLKEARDENERLRANRSLDAAPELQRYPFRSLAKTEPEDIDKLVTVCRMNAMASSPHVALTHLTIAGTLLALRDEVERLRVTIPAINASEDK